MLRSQNITLVAGQTPASGQLELGSQQVPIRGVVVDNANSTIPIWVYGGPSPDGVPFIVQPGWARGFSVEGPSAVYIKFPQAASAAGQAAITVSSDPQVAFSSQVITEFTPEVTLTSDYPDSVLNNNLAAGIWGGVGTSGTSPLTIDSFSISSVTGAIYVTSILFQVASMTAFSLAASGATLVPNYPVKQGAGPIAILFGKPWYLSNANGVGGTVNIVATWTGTGVLVYYAIQGYYL